jgi:glycosyltransferase involved in cell wall biosynthesis
LRPYASVGSNRQVNVTQQNTLLELTDAGLKIGPDNYTGDILAAVSQYADRAVIIAAAEDFDVVHAHDWMTYPAGQAVSRQNNKPLVVHVHSTEFDRSGEHVNQIVYDIERNGMHAASKVIAVSNLTKETIVKRYGVKPAKVEVVYNAVEHNGDGVCHIPADKKDKIVLFLGRITMQKGPEYFLAAAKKVIDTINNVKFIMVGSGDMMNRIVELAASMGIGNKVLFTGFLTGEDVTRAYKMADLYVMPSVSEPFGISSLEAMNRNVPVLMSKTSGIAEAVSHALKVDFWDIDEMANKMIAVLKRPSLKATLGKNGFHESHKFNWEDSAIKVKNIYDEVIEQSKSKEKQ